MIERGTPEDLFEEGCGCVAVVGLVMVVLAVLAIVTLAVKYL